MVILITEDDFVGRRLLMRHFQGIGEIEVAVNGKEAVAAARLALTEGTYYDLICLDIMMSGLDGIQALQSIRQLEAQHGLTPDTRAKVFMTTASSEKGKVVEAVRAGCDAYLIKPITRIRMLEEMARVGLAVPVA